MSAPGQAAAFASGRRRGGGTQHDTQAWSDELKPLPEQFGGDVAHLGGYSSGTETRAGSDALRRSTALFLPTGRMRYAGKLAIFGSQVVFFGDDVEAFRTAIDRLRDPRRPLLPMPGIFRAGGRL